MSIHHDEFVARVRELAGFAGREETDRAIEATLATLGERLVDSETRALSSELPPPLARAIARGTYTDDFDCHELYDRVAGREGVERNFGAEHAQAVCRALAEQLSLDARVRLRKELDPSIADLFALPGSPEPVDAPEHVEHPEHAPPQPRRTLSEGRPGSRHPLSEARLDRAQTNSVARADEPHAETKLSSARGLTQERLHETLAAGRPGPKRPPS